MAQRESKLNLEMAQQQRRLAHASKRDSTAMKALSLLGAMFLPGTFVASLLSMSFFDFNVGEYSLKLSTHSTVWLRSGRRQSCV